MWPLILVGLGLYAYYKYTHPASSTVAAALANGGSYAFQANAPLDLATLTTTMTVAGMIPIGTIVPTGVSQWAGIFQWTGVNGPVPALNGVTFTSIAPVINPATGTA